MSLNIKEYNFPVSENIAKVINEKGLKQQSIAQKAGYSEQTLSDMLNGRKIIRIIDVIKIKDALEVDTNILFRAPKKGGG